MEISNWHRMGQLTPPAAATHAPLLDAFARTDLPSTPFDGRRLALANEAGFAGNLPLAHAVLSDAQEENQELGVTVSGGFGRMSLAFTPQVAERISPEWMYAGEPGSALRLDLSAVGTYWIGSYNEGGRRFSYLEAVDVSSATSSCASPRPMPRATATGNPWPPGCRGRNSMESHHLKRK